MPTHPTYSPPSLVVCWFVDVSTRSNADQLSECGVDRWVGEVPGESAGFAIRGVGERETAFPNDWPTDFLTHLFTYLFGYSIMTSHSWYSRASPNSSVSGMVHLTPKKNLLSSEKKHTIILFYVWPVPRLSNLLTHSLTDSLALTLSHTHTHTHTHKHI